MGRWKQVKWTEARQLTSILGWPATDRDDQPPEGFFDGLRAEGRNHEAAMFLGQALPRFEVVTWAARSVRDLSPPQPPPADADALKAAFLWLQDPSENRRRAAFEAASAADTVAPQRLCALAVFFSGGSLAPENLEPVLAPKETAGKFAAAAVISAASASGKPAEALDAALKLGEALAVGSDAA
ncbi:MAG: DUF6931 family protein [Phenylobacterium sp.]